MAQWSPAQHRRGRRGQQHADLAAEVFRSLFTGGRDVGGAGRRAEWTCSCGVTNFADRRDCRYCEKARGGQQAQVLERSVGVPKSAAEKPPGARADAIGRVAQQVPRVHHRVPLACFKRRPNHFEIKLGKLVHQVRSSMLPVRICSAQRRRQRARRKQWRMPRSARSRQKNG